MQHLLIDSTGKDYRRSSHHQENPEATVSVFQSHRTSSVGSSRRHRGFQPDEVNKNKEKLGPSITKGADNMIAINGHSNRSVTTNNPGSTMTPKSTQSLAPHRRTQVHNKESGHQNSSHIQVATMDASRPELDPVHFGDVSTPVESETSSLQIITERKPSCWSIASPPEARPTEWNSAVANIDRPARKTLPIYRIPRQQHKAECEPASNSSDRHEAKLNLQATGSNAQKIHELNGSTRFAPLEKDELPATARVASLEDGHATNSLHQRRQPQHGGRLQAEEASQVNPIQVEALARITQASSEAQLKSNELKAFSPTRNILQAVQLDGKETNITSSAVSSQAKINQVFSQPGKQSGTVSPHLRVQSARPGSDNKDKPLPPHLRSSVSPSITTATKATAHDEDFEPGKHTMSKVMNEKTISQADQNGYQNRSKRMLSKGLTVGPSAGALQDVTKPRKNVDLAVPSKLDAESSGKKSKRPEREVERADDTSGLVGWDGKMNPPPVGDEWDRRQPFNPQSRERLSVIKAWREQHAADPEEKNRVMVNTASADFQTGEGLAGGDVKVLSPINKMDHETRTCNDEFTQARRHQNAAEAMKKYEAKIAAKPKPDLCGIEGMTKEEKRALRRTLIEQERTRVIPPNPHAPAANIYLRPAEFKDMGQVMNIYNYYVRETNFVLHLDPVDELYWYVSSFERTCPSSGS